MNAENLSRLTIEIPTFCSLLIGHAGQGQIAVPPVFVRSDQKTSLSQDISISHQRGVSLFWSILLPLTYCPSPIIATDGVVRIKRLIFMWGNDERLRGSPGLPRMHPAVLV